VYESCDTFWGCASQPNLAHAPGVIGYRAAVALFWRALSNYNKLQSNPYLQCFALWLKINAGDSAMLEMKFTPLAHIERASCYSLVKYVRGPPFHFYCSKGERNDVLHLNSLLIAAPNLRCIT
jgi:hypothetical protein